MNRSHNLPSPNRPRLSILTWGSHPTSAGNTGVTTFGGEDTSILSLFLSFLLEVRSNIPLDFGAEAEDQPSLCQSVKMRSWLTSPMFKEGILLTFASRTLTIAAKSYM